MCGISDSKSFHDSDRSGNFHRNRKRHSDVSLQRNDDAGNIKCAERTPQSNQFTIESLDGLASLDVSDSESLQDSDSSWDLDKNKKQERKKRNKKKRGRFTD